MVKIVTMALPKFEKQYMEMIELNKSAFEELKEKGKNPKSEEFAEIQRKIIRIVRRTEDRLCSKTENARYGSFSTNLADKFWEKVRESYPEVDYAESD